MFGVRTNGYRSATNALNFIEFGVNLGLVAFFKLFQSYSAANSVAFGVNLVIH